MVPSVHADPVVSAGEASDLVDRPVSSMAEKYKKKIKIPLNGKKRTELLFFQ